MWLKSHLVNCVERLWWDIRSSVIVAPMACRARMLTCADNIGNLFSAVILDLCSTYIANPANENQYKIPLYIMIALPFVISIGVFTMLSESPVWLVLHNRLPEAMKALKWIYPYMTVDELEVELAKIQYTVEKELEAAEMVG